MPNTSSKTTFYLSAQDRERFLDRCIPTHGAGNHVHYPGSGKMKLGDGTWLRAHQMAYFVEYGDLPRKLSRTCSDGNCINPEHWIDGTQSATSYLNRPEKEPREPEIRFHKGTGQWYVYHSGRQHYLGNGSKRQAAERWAVDRVFILNGKAVPKANTKRLTVGEVLDQWLEMMHHNYDAGKIAADTISNARSTHKRLKQAFAPEMPCDKLTPQIFTEVVRAWEARKDISRVTVQNYIKRGRAPFKWAMEQLEAMPRVRFGTDFKCCSKQTNDKLNRRESRKNGKTKRGTFDAAEIRSMVKVADPIRRAQVLLAINMGMGPSDLNDVRMGDFEHLRLGVFYTPRRVKTGYKRRAYIWKQTWRAIELAYAARPVPQSDDLLRNVFLSDKGFELIPGSSRAGYNNNFNEMQRAAGVYIDGRGTYALRHSFKSIGKGAGMPDAVQLAMGKAHDTYFHPDEVDSMDARLKRTALFVQNWVWPKKKRRKVKSA